MTWHEQLIDAVRLAAAEDARVVELRVHGSAAAAVPGALDDWSDVDVAVLLDPTADEHPLADWPARFGDPWALTRHRDADLAVQRVVYDDGRRLDLVSTSAPSAMPAGRVLHRRSATPDGSTIGQPSRRGLDQPTAGPAEELMDLRLTAALAVVKFARADLLIGLHLAPELVRRCLVLAMVLRDRDTGRNSHRVGGPRNEVVAELDTLRRHPWTTAGGIDLVHEVIRIYDTLAVQVDPHHVPDSSGLDALVRQARASEER